MYCGCVLAFYYIMCTYTVYHQCIYCYYISKIFEIEEIIISKLKELGILFGLVFQITDDILDIEQDSKDSKKAMNNICIILGLKKTINEFYKNINLLENEFKKLNIFNTNFEDLLNQLKKRIE